MKAEDIIRHMKATIPLLTDDFSTQLAVSSIAVSGTTVTVTTTAAHGLTTGDFVTVLGAKGIISVSSITHVDGLVTIVTVQNHDVTFNEVIDKIIPQIEISGANESEWNDTFNVDLPPPDRKTINIKVPDTHTTPATGTILLFDNGDRGLNGQQAVTVTGASIFTYTLSSAPDIESAILGTVTIQKDVRITGSITVERALRAYTAQTSEDKLYAFVILGDTTVSKDRNINTDASGTIQAGDDFRQRLVHNLQILIFVPSSEDNAGARKSRDSMQDVRAFLFRSLLNFRFDDGLCEEEFSGLTFTSDGLFTDEESFFVHQFAFEMVSDIVGGDVNLDINDVAFRDIAIDFLPTLPDTDLTVNIDLDDEPIP